MVGKAIHIFFVAVIFVGFLQSSAMVLAEGPSSSFQSGTNSTGGITNPLEQGGISTVSGLLGKVINWMLGLVGFIALIALITGGARMIMDFGNEEQVKKGKTTILWAVIGLLVVILSYAIINIVTGEILGGGNTQSATQKYDPPVK